jgi:tRNA(Ile)-lysidine synthase
MLGLAGMPPVRNRIIRPLIEISREQILDYLRGHSLPFRIDRTNQDTSILRNRIRTDLTPMLKTYNPEIITAISRTEEVLREDEQFMQDASRKAFAKLAKIEPGRVIFSAANFRDQPKSIRRRLIRHAIERLKTDLRKIEAVHIFDLERMLDSGTASFELDLPGSIRIVKSYDLLAVESMSVKKETGFKPIIVQAPCRTKIPVSSDFEIEFTAEPADFAEFQKSLGNKVKRESIFSFGEDDDWIALDKIEGALELRPPKPGDRIIPLGMKGHRKLKDIFVELKVPREQRAFYPVLSDSSGLLWIPGFGISEKAKVKPKSAQIALLKIKVVKRSNA